MVKIRLARTGAKKRPFYHIVVADQRRFRDGRYIERLGYYNPVAIGGERPLKIDVERVDYWKEQGAQMSERVLGLVKYFNKHGDVEAPKRAAAPVSKTKPAPAPKPAAEEDEAEEVAASEEATEQGAEAGEE